MSEVHMSRFHQGSDRDDPVWNTAWSWVVREHEQPLDDAARTELVAWLKCDPTHLASYEEASRIWLAAALVPSSADSFGISEP